jgi:hypothetical protein
MICEAIHGGILYVPESSCLRSQVNIDGEQTVKGMVTPRLANDI